MKQKPNSLKLTRYGVFKRDDINPKKRWIKVAPAIRVVAIVHDATQKRFYVKVRFEDRFGKRCFLIVDCALLLPEKRSELKTLLVNSGYKWPRDKSLGDAILEILHDTQPSLRLELVNAPGWHGEGFALPDCCIGRTKKARRVVINPEAPDRIGEFRIGDGTLKDWQRTVARPSRKSSPMRVSIAAAFAATMLRPLNIDSFAINWFGESSQGKTLMLKVSASVAGLYDKSGAIPTWAASEPGFESQAVGHRDSVLPLDEAAAAEGKSLPLATRARILAFAIGSNGPRQLSPNYERRLRLTGREFRIIVLSTSERALSDIALKGGDPRLTGEKVRLIDVAADESGSLGIFDNMSANSRISDSRALVEKIERAAQQYCGHALRAFLHELVRDPHWVQSAGNYIVQFAEKAPPKIEETPTYRVQKLFGVIWAAAALAIDYGILPSWTKRETFKAVRKCFDRAIDRLQAPDTALSRPQATGHSAAVKSKLTAKLATAAIVKIAKRKSVDEVEKLKRQAADGFSKNGVILVKNHVFESWFPARVDRDALKAAGVFDCRRLDTPTVEKKIKGIPGKPRYYLVKRQALATLMPA